MIQGQQTIAYGPNLPIGLFLYGPQAKNGFYIFKGWETKQPTRI